MKPLELAALMGALEDLRKAYPEIEEDESLLLGMVEGETNAFEVLAVIASEEREADELETAAESRERTVKARKMRFRRKKAAYRAMALRIMEAAGIRKAELAEVTLSIRAGQQSAVVTDENDLPDRFWKVTREPKLNDIKDAIKAGEFVPGAALSNGGDCLSVRKS